MKGRKAGGSKLCGSPERRVLRVNNTCLAEKKVLVHRSPERRATGAVLAEVASAGTERLGLRRAQRGVSLPSRRLDKREGS